MANKEDIFSEALELGPQERAELAQELLHSLDGVEQGAEPAWRAEIDRRAREVAEGRVKTVTLERVRQEVDVLLAELRGTRT